VGASDFFGVKPDMICLAKSIGGGAPLGAFGASRAVMDLISQHKVFQTGLDTLVVLALNDQDLGCQPVRVSSRS